MSSEGIYTRQLIQDLGLVLAVCLQDVVQIRPKDPIDFIAQWLYKYSDSTLYYDGKEVFFKTVRTSIQAERDRRRVSREQMKGLNFQLLRLMTFHKRMSSEKKFEHISPPASSHEYDYPIQPIESDTSISVHSATGVTRSSKSSGQKSVSSSDGPVKKRRPRPAKKQVIKRRTFSVSTRKKPVRTTAMKPKKHSYSYSFSTSGGSSRSSYPRHSGISKEGDARFRKAYGNYGLQLSSSSSESSSSDSVSETSDTVTSETDKRRSKIASILSTGEKRSSQGSTGSTSTGSSVRPKSLDSTRPSRVGPNIMQMKTPDLVDNMDTRSRRMTDGTRQKRRFLGRSVDSEAGAVNFEEDDQDVLKKSRKDRTRRKRSEQRESIDFSAQDDATLQVGESEDAVTDQIATSGRRLDKKDKMARRIEADAKLKAWLKKNAMKESDGAIRKYDDDVGAENGEFEDGTQFGQKGTRELNHDEMVDFKDRGGFMKQRAKGRPRFNMVGVREISDFEEEDFDDSDESDGTQEDLSEDLSDADAGSEVSQDRSEGGRRARQRSAKRQQRMAAAQTTKRPRYSKVVRFSQKEEEPEDLRTLLLSKTLQDIDGYRDDGKHIMGLKKQRYQKDESTRRKAPYDIQLPHEEPDFDEHGKKKTEDRPAFSLQETPLWGNLTDERDDRTYRRHERWRASEPSIEETLRKLSMRSDRSSGSDKVRRRARRTSVGKDSPEQRSSATTEQDEIEEVKKNFQKHTPKAKDKDIGKGKQRKSPRESMDRNVVLKEKQPKRKVSRTPDLKQKKRTLADRQDLSPELLEEEHSLAEVSVEEKYKDDESRFSSKSSVRSKRSYLRKEGSYVDEGGRLSSKASVRSDRSEMEKEGRYLDESDAPSKASVRSERSYLGQKGSYVDESGRLSSKASVRSDRSKMGKEGRYLDESDTPSKASARSDKSKVQSVSRQFSEGASSDTDVDFQTQRLRIRSLTDEDIDEEILKSFKKPRYAHEIEGEQLTQTQRGPERDLRDKFDQHHDDRKAYEDERQRRLAYLEGMRSYRDEYEEKQTESLRESTQDLERQQMISLESDNDDRGRSQPQSPRQKLSSKYSRTGMAKKRSSQATHLRSIVFGTWYYLRTHGVMVFHHPILGELRSRHRSRALVGDNWDSEDSPCEALYDSDIYTVCDRHADDADYASRMLEWTGDTWVIEERDSNLRNDREDSDS